MIYTLSGFILSFPKLYSRSYPLTISTGYSFTLWLHHLEEEKASWHYFSLSLRVTELFCCDQDLVALLSTRPLDVLLLVLLCDPCRRLWQELFCALQPFRRSSHAHVQHQEIAFASHQVEKGVTDIYQGHL